MDFPNCRRISRQGRWDGHASGTLTSRPSDQIVLVFWIFSLRMPGNGGATIVAPDWPSRMMIFSCPEPLRFSLGSG